jgi:trans-aconitate methyltransferase
VARAGRAAVKRTEFNADFFRRFYLDAKTRVISRAEMRARVAVIAAVLRHTAIPVRSILDAGCGLGLMREPFRKMLPRARYHGIEVSEYLCRKFGWRQASLLDYAPQRRFDLVVCYDVLQYLTDREAAQALNNLERLTAAAIYVSALTRADWRQNCDRSRTDRAVHLRTGAWYRARLAKHFRPLGLGLWIRKDVTAILWEMERA